MELQTATLIHQDQEQRLGSFGKPYALAGNLASEPRRDPLSGS